MFMANTKLRKNFLLSIGTVGNNDFFRMFANLIRLAML